MKHGLKMKKLQLLLNTYEPWYIVNIRVHLQNLTYYILLLCILFNISGVFLVRYMSFL